MKTQTVSLRRVVRDSVSFEHAIQNLLDVGVRVRGRAILIAREYAPEKYNAWIEKRSREAARSGSGGDSIMQHFRIVGG